MPLRTVELAVVLQAFLLPAQMRHSCMTNPSLKATVKPQIRRQVVQKRPRFGGYESLAGRSDGVLGVAPRAPCEWEVPDVFPPTQSVLRGLKL